MWAFGCVKLIPEASQADVLSDVGLNATGRAGELALIFVTRGKLPWLQTFFTQIHGRRRTVIHRQLR